MVDRQALLGDLRRVLGDLKDDLRERCRTHPEVDAPLREEYRAARDARRTAETYEAWQEEALTQAAVAWILGCVFVRFMEDNDLVDPPRLAGPGERLQVARDHHTLYFRAHPVETDREYLLDVFRTVAALPAARSLSDEAHNPLWRIAPSGDAAGRLLAFWQRIDPATGRLVHDFTDPAADTRFLGDLYQDLSESARKRYALLQTPEFVEEFILDRTLGPAIREFGYQAVRLIDPACGSGHFLLGAFRRFFELWLRHEPATNARELARRALDQVSGVDLNPFAAAIARFRLLVAALRASDLRRLADAPAFRINVAAGDSLLHGPRFRSIRGTQTTIDSEADPLRHVYAAEDADELRRILGQQYHVVVGNPPYITVKDPALNQAYRERFGSCHRQYSLVVPFLERFFELALPGDERTPTGFVGLIGANSFMRREFGRKLIEEFIPRWDLTHVIHTSGAHIPAHGTPTVILFGRNREPVARTVRAVMGIRGEPKTPQDPAKGRVWTAIVNLIDQPGSQSQYVSVADMPRDQFQKHPWSLGGGGAAELKPMIEEAGTRTLSDTVDAISSICITRGDHAYLLPRHVLDRRGIPVHFQIVSVQGEHVRDWSLHDVGHAIYPYDDEFLPVSFAKGAAVHRFLWPYREHLWRRRELGGDHRQLGRTWWEWNRFLAHRMRVSLSITFAFKATHNHFVLDRGGKVFNRTAPVIKLPLAATEDDHLALLGLLNSSTACFWMKQTMWDTGVGGIGGGIGDEAWEPRYELDGKKLMQFPTCQDEPLALARTLERSAAALERSLPGALVERVTPSAPLLEAAKAEAARLRKLMITLQEELDWKCYRSYGLLDEDLFEESVTALETTLGERAFEIVMARKIANGELETAWFERHGSTPITDIPAHWPEGYRKLVARRIEVIETNPDIALIEQPQYKRRWNAEPWEVQQERALHGWLLDRLESAPYWPRVELTTCARLADRAQDDGDFIQVAELYRGRADFDVTALVRELVEAEAVPFLPVLRYSALGLSKRTAWEETWQLQRLEDTIDARTTLPPGDPERIDEAEAAALKAREVEEIPVPPKYTSADFLSPVYWRLRGKFDVPKERFILYPGCERAGDATPVVGWAGWDHLQQAQALAAYHMAMREGEGWPAERLAALLAGLLELMPWLLQWHNDLDPIHGVRLGDYYASFVEEEIRALGLSLDVVRASRPTQGVTRTNRSGRTARSRSKEERTGATRSGRPRHRGGKRRMPPR